MSLLSHDGHDTPICQNVRNAQRMAMSGRCWMVSQFLYSS